MLKLYELLAKVGTNPKLRAWAMEQLIKLKHVKKGYKKSFTHQMDLNRVKDVRNPNWLTEQVAKEKSYNLKNKVVDIAKAKEKIRWDKVDKQSDKDKFYGVTGQVETWLKKIGKDTDEFFKKHELDQKWLNKMIKAEKKGDPRAKKILDDHFKKLDKDFADKIIPFKPNKAEGGRIGFDDGGPSQKEIDKGLKAIEKLKSSLMPESYEELIEIYKDKQKDLNIDIMESAGGLGEMLGEGGRIGLANGTTMDLKYINPGLDKSEGMASGMGGFPLPAAIAGTGIFALSQKDKGKKTPQKKEGPNFPEPPEDKEPSILSELARGEILQNLYKGVKGLQHGAIERKLREKYGKGFEAYEKAMNEATEIVNQRKLKIVEDKMSEVNIGSDAYVDLIDEHIRMTDREMYKDIKRWENTRPDLADKTRTLFFPDWAEAQYGEDYQSVLNNRQAATLKQKSEEIDKMYPDTDKDIGPSFVGEQQMVDEIDEMNKANLDELLKGRKKNASGGRIGMMYGGDPGFAFSYGGSWADWKENHASEMPVMDYINQKLPKARNPFTDTRYEEGGSVKPMTPEEFSQLLFQKPYNQLKPSEQQQVDGFTSSKAEGGRIGMAKGDTPSEAYLRDLFYDGGWDAKGDIGLHEFMHGPIGANEWFKHNSKAEGGRIGFKKGGKGGIGDLMSELYRLFSISPLLGSPELTDLIQKIPFEKGGRAGFEKGGKSWWNNPMTRRTFGKLGIMGALTSLGMKFGPKIAKTKPVKDISVKLKSWIDDSDEMTEWGPQAVGRWAANFDISSLTPQGVTILKKLFGKSVKTVTDKAGKVTASINSTLDDAAGYVDDIIKKGKGSIDFKYLDDTGAPQGVEGALAHYAKTFGKNSKLYKDFLKRSKKMTEKQKIQYELSNDYSLNSVDETGAVDDVINLIYGKGKGEGGSVGYPPVQLGPLDLTPRASGSFTEGPYGPKNEKRTWSDNIGIGGVLDLPGGFSLTGEYDKYRTKDRLYTADDEYLDERVSADDDRWKLGLQWKKNFAKGGKAWQPKSAPQLTTTIPPESGPMPHGLTYLTGDDIVQNIGHKHGRN